MNNKFSDYKDINLQFKEFVGQEFSEDLLKNAILLENFILDFFGIALKDELCLTQNILDLHNFIKNLSKYFLKSSYKYKKKKEIATYSDFKLLELFYCYKSKNSNKLFQEKEGNYNELIIYPKIEKKNITECFAFSNKLSNDCQLSLSIDSEIYFDDFRSYLLDVINSESYLSYRLSNPIFNVPKKIDFNNLIGEIDLNPLVDDFNFHWIYDDNQENHSKIQANYCLKCHERNNDSCKKGLKNKKGNVDFLSKNEGNQGSKENTECDYLLKYQKNQFGKTLDGCPLEEHISEGIKLFESGNIIASLAIMMINNPLIPLTGYRICNDCVKSCIFQKQSQVDIPSIETTILHKVLHLPFGVEIYHLLTQWNPLNNKAILPQESNRKKILVVGLGPAGISASYHFLRNGFSVTALEGCKIEKLDEFFINKIHENFEEEYLEDRVIGGFGGVMEYGITSRWNKNYLKIVQLVLERNKNFSYFDGIKFGSNYFVEDALEDGFDHIVLATGGGRQKIAKNIKLFNNVRLATDFLVTLQLGGIYKWQDYDFAGNFQLLLPAVVLGGGLTAVDAATEILNYYPRQVLKFYKIVEDLGFENVKNELNDKEIGLFNEFIEHAEKIKKCNSQREIYDFLKSIGGVKIVYRRNIGDSMAYQVNHEELRETLRKGIEFVENFELDEVISDKDNSVSAIRALDGKEIKARNLFVACGSTYNLDFLKKIGISEEKILKFYSRLENVGLKEKHSTLIDDKISIIGDMNPQYSGSVVKAILSGRNVSEEIKS